MTSRILETCNKSVISHSINIKKTATDILISTMCNFSPEQHDYPQWKCVLQCCSNCTRLVIPVEESNRVDTTMCPTIHLCLSIDITLYIDIFFPTQWNYRRTTT